ncbi:hypothetical protein GCM10029978_052320 [Actinoallomurus acanthiterrae]
MVGERYRLRERLAAGGVGEVWRADDTVLDRPVAVKLLRPEHADNEEYRERLRLEGRHLVGLSHPRLAGPGGRRSRATTCSRSRSPTATGPSRRCPARCPGPYGSWCGR